jgi:hypothetical protein
MLIAMPRLPVALLWSLGAGLAAGLMFASASSGGRFSVALLCFVALPLFMAGLALGLPSAAIGGVVGTALVLVLANPLNALVFFATFALPAAVLTRQALLSREVASPAGGAPATEWYPSGGLVAWATGLCVAMVSAVFLFHASEDGGLRGVLMRQADAQVDWLKEHAPRVMKRQDENQVRAMARFVGELKPMLFAVGGLSVVLLNGCLAQWGLTRMGRNLRPSPSLADFRMPAAMALALAAATGLTFLGQDFAHYALTIIAILAVPYVLAGLIVMHVLTRQRPGRTVLLVLTYLCLMIFTFPLVVLGLVDQAFDLRGRFGRHSV